MNKKTDVKALLEKLQVVEGANFHYDEKAILEEYEKDGENQSSLAIKILSVFGGIAATLAFLAFLAIVGLYESEVIVLVFGIAFIVAAIWLNRMYHQLIIDTFSVSIYAVGFALLAFGLVGLKVDENIIAILIIAISLLSLFISQNYILSFISVLVISVALLFLIFSNEGYNLVHLYIGFYTLLLTFFMLNEAEITVSNNKLAKLYNPIRIGLIISLLFGLVILGKRHLVPIAENYIWLTSFVMIPVVLYLVNRITEITNRTSTNDKLLIYPLSVLLLLPTVFAPSISGAILILLLSFLVNYKTGLALGIISLIYFISQYYYDLNLTLLTKSIILFFSGIVFLLFYFFTSREASLMNDKN